MFGTGQVGSHVVTALVAAGHDVTAVSRSGGERFDGASTVGGDATDAAFTTKVAAGADAVYFCLNAGNYARWAEEFPPLQHGVLAGAEAAGARLVVLDNLYSYGPTHGADLVETMQARPSSTKAAIRAAMTDELLAAHHAGRVEVAIGRASDYFGPGAVRSALGETVFATALTGRTAQVMGDIDTLHSYSYTPDVAAALVTLGTHPDACGSVWHLPVAETRTTAGDHRPRLPARRSSAPKLRRRAHDAAAVRTGQAGDARVPPHAVPVHRPLGRRRHQVPRHVRRPHHTPRRRARHHPPVVPPRRRGPTHGPTRSPQALPASDH